MGRVVRSEKPANDGSPEAREQEARPGDAAVAADETPAGAGDDSRSADAANDVDNADNDVTASEGEPAQEAGDDADTQGAAQDVAQGVLGEDDAATAPIAETGPLVEERPEPRSGSIFPLLLGGVVAAVTGYGAAQIMPRGWPLFAPPDAAAELAAKLRERLDSQNDQIAGLRERITQPGTGSDPAADQIEARIEARFEALSEQLNGLRDRLGEVELRPLAGGVAEETVNALRDRIAALESRIDDMATAGAEQLGTAKQTLLRAAITRLETAIDSGESFADTLREIAEGGDVDIPAGLNAHAAGGVPTEAELRDGFPEAARAAIAAEIRALVADGGISRLSGFFRRQLGMRSLRPREGADADAILSRAEAALNSGDPATGLAELQSLSDAAAAQMQGWVEMAQERQDALTGATELNAALGGN